MKRYRYSPKYQSIWEGRTHLMYISRVGHAYMSKSRLDRIGRLLADALNREEEKDELDTSQADG
jgi:hypothetical protein